MMGLFYYAYFSKIPTLQPLINPQNIATLSIFSAESVSIFA